LKAKFNESVQIRVQQRKGSKYITTVSGLSTDNDLTKILRCLKRNFCCGGEIVEDTTFGKLLQLQGDQSLRARDFLINEGLAPRAAIKVHGSKESI